MPDNPRLDEGEDNRSENVEASLIKRLLDARTIMVSEVVTDKLAQKVTTAALLMQDADKEKFCRGVKNGFNPFDD